MQSLSRQETEDLIIDLYYNQKKTFREIQKIVRKSPRDIRSILDKVEPERASLSVSSRAYQMFMEGSSPMHVAITLNLRENQVNEYYKEYWNLNGLYHLSQVYEEIKDDIWSIIELFRRTRSEGLSQQQISRILKTIITLEHKNRDLEGEQARLEVGNKQAAKTIQQLTDSIQNDHKTLEKNYSVISQQKQEIFSLNKEKTRLENFINSIQLNSETCVKIKQIVKQEIESIVSNPTRLIRLALAALFESSRKHPGKFQALYYNMPPHLSVEQILAQSSISQSGKPYEDSEDEKFLLHEAEQSYNRIIDAITSNCINGMPNNAESSSQILRASHEQDIGSNREIFDTVDLSGVDLAYNNIEFNVYPAFKITNEKSSGPQTSSSGPEA